MNIVNVGFIGLGNVGSKLASNIIKGNFHLFVNDLDKNKSKNLIYEGANGALLWKIWHQNQQL